MKEGWDDRVVVLLVVEYVTRGVHVGVKVVSVVSLEFGSDGRVVRHEERWMGVPLLGGKAVGGLGKVFQMGRGVMGWVTCVVVDGMGVGCETETERDGFG